MLLTSAQQVSICPLPMMISINSCSTVFNLFDQLFSVVENLICASMSLSPSLSITLLHPAVLGTYHQPNLQYGALWIDDVESKFDKVS